MVATLARYDCTDVEHSNTFFYQKTFFSIDLNSIRPRFQLRSELVVRAAGLRITREPHSPLVFPLPLVPVSYTHLTLPTILLV